MGVGELKTSDSICRGLPQFSLNFLNYFIIKVLNPFYILRCRKKVGFFSPLPDLRVTSMKSNGCVHVTIEHSWELDLCVSPFVNCGHIKKIFTAP